MKLKVGDRVRIKNERGKRWNCEGKMDKWMGQEVTINEIDGRDIHTKEDAGEHWGGELGGWFWQENDFELLDDNEKDSERPDDNETLIIYHKGNETIGILKKNGKEIRRELAKCRKDDMYIFPVGVEMVIERIFSPEKPKMFDAKVVCVHSKSEDFTKGKVYVVNNGTIQGNENKYSNFRDLEGINLQLDSQFIEFLG